MFLFFPGELGSSVSSEPYKVTLLFMLPEIPQTYVVVLYKVLRMVLGLSFFSVQL